MRLRALVLSILLFISSTSIVRAQEPMQIQPSILVFPTETPLDSRLADMEEQLRAQNDTSEKLNLFINVLGVFSTILLGVFGIFGTLIIFNSYTAKKEAEELLLEMRNSRDEGITLIDRLKIGVTDVLSYKEQLKDVPKKSDSKKELTPQQESALTGFSKSAILLNEDIREAQEVASKQALEFISSPLMQQTIKQVEEYQKSPFFKQAMERIEAYNRALKRQHAGVDYRAFGRVNDDEKPNK